MDDMRAWYTRDCMKISLSILLGLAILLSSFSTASAQEIPRQSLIRGSGPAVYWYSSNGTRHVFPNEKTFLTWFPYHQYDRVLMVTDQALASIRLGQTLVYRPGSRLVKITTDPRVYAVDERGVLRWIETEAVAASLYGQNWQMYVDDIPDAFFINYTTGQSIRRASDFRPANTLTPDSNL